MCSAAICSVRWHGRLFTRRAECRRYHFLHHERLGGSGHRVAVQTYRFADAPGATGVVHDGEAHALVMLQCERAKSAVVEGAWLSKHEARTHGGGHGHPIELAVGPLDSDASACAAGGSPR